MSDRYYLKIRHVKREVFNAVSDRIHDDNEVRVSIIIHYDGTDTYGDITIYGTCGNSKAFNKALKILTEEYCK